MNVKRYLEQIQELRVETVLKIEELQELRSTIEGVQGMQISERVQTSAKNDAMDNAMIRLEKISNEIGSYIEELETKRKEIIEKVEKLKYIKSKQSILYYQVIYRRYILNQSWEKIGVSMNYSSRQVQRINGYALKEMEKILKGVA